MTSMEHVEHNTAIGWKVMNEDGIEGFSIFSLSVQALMRKVAIPNLGIKFWIRKMIYHNVTVCVP